MNRRNAGGVIAGGIASQIVRNAIEGVTGLTRPTLPQLPPEEIKRVLHSLHPGPVGTSSVTQLEGALFNRARCD